ncbi:hypothetical protein EVAR_93738_1 [Eumeta japonica]|uniref:Uncharacterized protein n=1 Tax=Eumeta variegata TaxID=151549 RepID=A0A4C1U3J3_EUMVA|nr:hypothetical protein EVAR_93738_1 [Eumeta japonica]
MNELSVKYLLYADDQVMLAPSACGLQEIVTKMNDSVKKREMNVNASKTNVMVFERSESATKWYKSVEQVKEFVYLENLYTNGFVFYDKASRGKRSFFRTWRVRNGFPLTNKGRVGARPRARDRSGALAFVLPAADNGRKELHAPLRLLLIYVNVLFSEAA